MGKRRRGARAAARNASSTHPPAATAADDHEREDAVKVQEDTRPPCPSTAESAISALGEADASYLQEKLEQVTRDQRELAKILRTQGVEASAFYPLLCSLVAGFAVGCAFGFDAGFAVGCTATLVSGIALVRRNGSRTRRVIRPAVVARSAMAGTLFGVPVAAVFGVCLGRVVGCRVGLVVGLITLVMKVFEKTGLKQISDMVGGGVIFGLAMLLIFGWTFGPDVGFHVMLCAATALGISTAIEHNGLDDRISGGIFYGGGFALGALLIVGTLVGLDAGVKCAVGSLCGIVLFFRLHYGPSVDPGRCVRVQVPAGVKPGQHFRVKVVGDQQGPSTVIVQCPEDAGPGQFITVDID